MRRLYIAAKAPRPGLVKTRLAQAIGEDSAVALYAAFLRDLEARFAAARAEPAWFVSPDGCWPEIASAAGIAGGPTVVNQGAGSWSQRQDRLFASAALRGESPVVLIASDSPQISIEYVEEAFDRLEHHDLVLGPVHDGGYCLLGMRGYQDLLPGIPMSTPHVLKAVRDSAVARGLAVALLRETFDVDEVKDLAALEAACRERDDLGETRRALALIQVGSARW